MTKATADQLSFQLRIYDDARFSWGTEVPVVREEEFLTSTTQLLAVPIRENFRLSLRIYEVDNREQTDFRVRIYDQEAGHLLVDQIVATTKAYAEKPELPPFAPTVALHGLAGLFPQLLSADLVRIEIDPQSTARFWCFVSITNNDTQHVTLITPQ